MSAPELVIFDLYGTLIRFGVQNHPYRKVMQWARQQGRPPRPEDARTIMTLSGGVANVFSRMGIDIPDHMLRQLNSEIEQEIESLTLFDDVISALSRLDSYGISMAICSNLAQPYGIVVDKLLSDFHFIKCLSYEVGYVKPEREMYEWIVSRSGVAPSQSMFVGDTLHADYEGPKEFGFRARHLVREGPQLKNEVIGDLADILSDFH